LTTLAIIGGGIAGRSLIYALAKSQRTFTEIVLFDSDSFAQTCSLRSTAIVSPRGVSLGHSDLGDLIVNGFATFSRHIASDRPQGVFPIIQYTGASGKLDQFKKRYPEAVEVNRFSRFEFTRDIYLTQESAFLIDTHLYLNWLMDQSLQLPLSIRNEFVTSCFDTEGGVHLKTQSGSELTFDQVVFTAGAYNHFWGQSRAGRPIQGSYFEFKEVDYGEDSFSLTLDSQNIIYQSHAKKLLIGSTTKDTSHVLASLSDLEAIYDDLQSKISLPLPPLKLATRITGAREKASKRKPYLFSENRKFWFGGLYKNGYSLSLHLAEELVSKL
jgi:glycine/D-amino acid oxidase-like deaminating enzyme